MFACAVQNATHSAPCLCECRVCDGTRPTSDRRVLHVANAPAGARRNPAYRRGLSSSSRSIGRNERILEMPRPVAAVAAVVAVLLLRLRGDGKAAKLPTPRRATYGRPRGTRAAAGDAAVAAAAAAAAPAAQPPGPANLWLVLYVLVIGVLVVLWARERIALAVGALPAEGGEGGGGGRSELPRPADVYKYTLVAGVAAAAAAVSVLLELLVLAASGAGAAASALLAASPHTRGAPGGSQPAHPPARRRR